MSHALTLPTTDATLSHTVSLLDRLFPPPRVFGVRLWDGTEPAPTCMPDVGARARRFACAEVPAAV